MKAINVLNEIPKDLVADYRITFAEIIDNELHTISEYEVPFEIFDTIERKIFINNKSAQCRNVLQLLDEDYEWYEAMAKTIEKFKLTESQTAHLEVELERFVFPLPMHSD